LPPPDEKLRTVSLATLSRFLANPAKTFLAQRLNIFLPRTPEEREDREPFVIDSLARARLTARLVEQRRRAEPATTAAAARSTEPPQPIGTGNVESHRVQAEVDRFLAAVKRQRDPKREPVELDLQVGAFRLVGRITEFTADGPLGYRCAKIKPKDLLEAWVLHLAANLQNPGRRTRWIGSDKQNVFMPPADPAALMESLLKNYWKGLQAPLRCFPRTSSQFVETLRGKPARPPGSGKSKTPKTPAPPPEKAREKALAAARVKWEGRETGQFQSPGESLDPHFQLCFREPDPLNSVFMELAEEILGPLLSHLVEEELP
jgi:exodeoxyribonuclease V gamma subunit